MAGLWCGTGPLYEFSLQLSQRAQDLEGTLTRKNKVRKLTARIEGNRVQAVSEKYGALVLTANSQQLRIVDGDGPLALLRGQVFQKAIGTVCGAG